MKLMIWSVLVAKRFRDVTMAPFGPSPYCDIISLYFTVSRISNLKIINKLSIFLETRPSHRGGTQLPLITLVITYVNWIRDDLYGWIKINNIRRRLALVKK